MIAPRPIYSMTGFASVESRTVDGTDFSLTVKGVNHRFLDLALRLPPGLEELEMAMRRMLKDRLRRGHVEVSLKVAKAETTTNLQLNEELLSAYVAAFRHAAELHGLDAPPELSALLHQPGVLRAEVEAPLENGKGLQSGVLASLSDTLVRFNKSRAEEGNTLAGLSRAAMRRLDLLAKEAAELREGVRAANVERLRGRMAELLQGAVAEERLLAEAAMLAERSDIDEELVRLRTHVARFLELLEEGGELGKRLDFLLQELAREANTLLSKTSGVAGLRVTELGLEMKVEIERVREQVQNLE